MDRNSMFMIYGRMNDRLTLMAKNLKAEEVTTKAKSVAKKCTRGEILILEEVAKKEDKALLARNPAMAALAGITFR